MKTKLNILVGLCFLLILTNCKKGEEDPTISLRSRRARLSGHWNLKQGQASFTKYHANKAPSNYNFSLSTNSFEENATEYGGVPTIYYGSYIFSLDFTKDGKFSFSENLAGYQLNASGTWDFNNGVGDKKSKEEITMVIESVSNGGTDEFHLFNALASTFTFRLKELSMKETKMTGSSYYYINSSGEKERVELDYTFVR